MLFLFCATGGLISLIVLFDFLIHWIYYLGVWECALNLSTTTSSNSSSSLHAGCLSNKPSEQVKCWMESNNWGWSDHCSTIVHLTSFHVFRNATIGSSWFTQISMTLHSNLISFHSSYIYKKCDHGWVESVRSCIHLVLFCDQLSDDSYFSLWLKWEEATWWEVQLLVLSAFSNKVTNVILSVFLDGVWLVLAVSPPLVTPGTQNRVSVCVSEWMSV